MVEIRLNNLNLGQDTLLCMTPQVRIPYCAWLPMLGYLTVHDSPDQDFAFFFNLGSRGMRDDANPLTIPPIP